MKNILKFKQNHFLFLINAFIFLAFITYLQYKKFYLLGEFMYDLENFNQAVWSIIHYGKPFLTSRGSLDLIRYAYHLDIILYLVAIPYYFFQSPLALIYIQSIVTALGGIFIYLLFYLDFKDGISAFMFQFLFYFNQLTLNYSLNAFHPEAMAASFLIISYYFFKIRQTFLFFIFAFLAFFCKENVSLIFLLFGLYLFISYKNKNIKQAKMGLLLATFAVIYFIFSMRAITYFAPKNQNAFFLKGFDQDSFSWLGNSYGEVIINILKKPRLILNKQILYKTTSYLSKIMDPFLYTPLLSPLIIVATPILFINVISVRADMFTINYHFHTMFVPVIFLSLIHFFRCVLKQKKKKNFRFIYAILLILIFFNAGHTLSLFKHYHFIDTVSSKEINQIIAVIGPEARVFSHPRLAYFFSSRRYNYFLSPKDGKIDYIILEKESNINIDNKNVIYEGERLRLFAN